MSVVTWQRLFRFLHAKCVSSYLCEVCHFVTQKVTTAKPVQTPLLTQNIQILCRFRQFYLKELFKKSATYLMGLIKFWKYFKKLIETLHSQIWLRLLERGELMGRTLLVVIVDFTMANSIPDFTKVNFTALIAPMHTGLTYLERDLARAKHGFEIFFTTQVQTNVFQNEQ